MEKKINRYKELKKKRIDPITEETNKLNGRIDYMKKVIIATLDDNGENSVAFPGVAKVIKKKAKAKWIVTDEKELLEYLKEENEYDNTVVETPKIVKKDLNSVLDKLSGQGKDLKGVEKDAGEPTISVSYDKSVSVPKKNIDVDTIMSDESYTSENNFDSLEV